MIQTLIQNRVLTITLNRPLKSNALSPQLVKELLLQFNLAKENTNLRAIILTHNGDAFCAGADLEYIQQMQDFTFQQNVDDSNKLRQLFDSIYEHPLPIIAKIKGHALAGGFGLAAVCDFCFATPNSNFGFTESKLGFIPALVSVYLKGIVPDKVLRNWFLTGKVFKAETALSFGIITQIESIDMIDDVVNKFVQKLILNNSGSSIKLTKQLLALNNGLPMNLALENAQLANANARSTTDCKLGIRKFLNKEANTW